MLARLLKTWLGGPPQGAGGRARMVDVGCGTGHTALALARMVPEAQFLGIDRSRASLRMARRLLAESGLKNVTFKYADLADDVSSFGKFRVVLCAGVLHHLESVAQGFDRIVQLTEEGGHLLVWLYSRYGRASHRMNQEFLRLLTASASRSESLKIAEAFVRHLGGSFALNSGFYTPVGSGADGLNYLLTHQAWLVDQMTPGFEQGLSLRDVLALFRSHNVQFVSWLGVNHDLAHYTRSRILLGNFRKLSIEDRLSAMDALLKPPYYFVAGKRASRRGSDT